MQFLCKGIQKLLRPGMVMIIMTIPVFCYGADVDNETGVCAGLGESAWSDSETRSETCFRLKRTISVPPFTSRVKDLQAIDSLGPWLSDLVSSELIRSERFLVVPLEPDLVEADPSVAEEDRTIPGESKLTAQYILEGTITEFNAKAGGGGLTFGYYFVKAGGKNRIAHFGLDIKIVNAGTGEVHASWQTVATANSSTTEAGLLFGDAFTISSFANSPIGQATQQAIMDANQYVAGKSESLPWQASLLLVTQEKTYINRGQNTGLRKGDRLQVFSNEDSLIDAETGINLGIGLKYLCDVTLTDVMSEFSIASSTRECENIQMQRGNIVRPR